jgi:hypothetical protein
VELDRAVEQDPNIHLPYLPEEFFKQLLNGQIIPKHTKTILLHNFHDYVDALVGEDEALSRITKADTKKFFNIANQVALIM